jgi:putative FmdB family regulatory protein
MPTYPYKCLKCGYRFEEFQLITEKPIAKCPECGGPVERVITGGAGFIFKGSGFYITDHRSEKYKKDAAKDVPGPAKVTTAKDKKPDSKAKD